MVESSHIGKLVQASIETSKTEALRSLNIECQRAARSRPPSFPLKSSEKKYLHSEKMRRRHDIHNLSTLLTTWKDCEHGVLHIHSKYNYRAEQLILSHSLPACLHSYKDHVTRSLQDIHSYLQSEITDRIE